MTFTTHGVKMIGSKRLLAPRIGEVIFALGAKTAIDVFTGTTRVAQQLRHLGIQTYTSDLSWASESYANTYVHNGENSHLARRIQTMNDLPGVEGWLTKNYCGVGVYGEKFGSGDGRCFRRKNTERADAARDWIDEQKDLKDWEKHTLITAVIRALDAVDNTTGTQQAYLKEWCDRSDNNIKFELPFCFDGKTARHYVGNALTIDYPTCDVAYLDAPYSAHSYSEYYHIWDSITKWDKPTTSVLKSRRRIDRVPSEEQFDKSMISEWNSKKTALDAFRQLIFRLPVEYIVVSYSDGSLVEGADLLGFGDTEMIEIEHPKNHIGTNPNKSNEKTVTEYLFVIKKG